MSRHMRTIVISALALQLATVPVAQAQSNATLVPAVSVGNLYDDNLFAKANGDAGVMTVVRPSLEGNYESPTLNLTSLFSFDMQHSNHSALSTFDARRHGDFDVHYRTTASTILGVGVRYDRTETPGELNLDTGILGERKIADRWELVPSLTYHVRPRTTINASYNGMTETLVDDIRSVLHVVRAGVTREVSTRDQITIGYLGRRFVDFIDPRTSNVPLVGWSRDLAFATHLSVQAGPRFSPGRNDAEILAGLTRNTPHLRTALDYWHGETIILGIHGPVDVDTASARFAWPVTLRSEIGLHTGFSNSTTLDDHTVRSYRAILVGAWTPRGGPLTVSAQYGAEFQRGLIRRSLFIDDDVVRQTISVNMTGAPRLSRTFRPTGEPPVGRRNGVDQ